MKIVYVFIILASWSFTPNLWGMFPQTQSDMQKALSLFSAWVKQAKNDPELKIFPLVIVQVEPYWQESKNDLYDEVVAGLKNQLSLSENPDQIIECLSCFKQSISSHSNGIVMEWNSGLIEKSLEKLGDQKPNSMLFVKELPSGLKFELVSLKNHHVLYSKIADSTVGLDQEVSVLSNYQREYYRRLRGEQLVHFHYSIGVPTLVSLEWLEQWGDYNQYMTGINFSGGTGYGGKNFTLIGLGGYTILKKPKKLTVGMVMGYNFMKDKGGLPVALQLVLIYPFHSNFGAFANIGTNFASLGLSIFNSKMLAFSL